MGSQTEAMIALAGKGPAVYPMGDYWQAIAYAKLARIAAPVQDDFTLAEHLDRNTRNGEFESTSLQRGVFCEADFLRSLLRSQTSGAPLVRPGCGSSQHSRNSCKSSPG